MSHIGCRFLYTTLGVAKVRLHKYKMTDSAIVDIVSSCNPKSNTIENYNIYFSLSWALSELG